MSNQSSPPGPPFDLHRFVTQQYARLKQYFRRRVAEPTCYDLAQDVVTVFIQKPVEEMDDPQKFLWGIARLRWLQHLERAGSRERFEHLLRESFRTMRSPSSVIDRRQRARELIAGLDVEELQAFELSEVYELPWEAVAEAMGVSVSTAKRRARDARDKLDELIGEQETNDAVREIRESDVEPGEGDHHRGDASELES